MNTDDIKLNRTNKNTTTVIVGAITLAIGLAIGVTAESHAGNSGSSSVLDATTNQMTATSSGSASTLAADPWNPFQQIRNMQSQMDQMFNQMNQQFAGQASLHGFTDIPGYSLSLDVRDLKNKYEVHAYLPDAKASDVHVKLANNQTLNVKVDSRQSRTTDKQNVAASVTELGQYDQTIQLPTPVKADQMKITRNGHDLIITLPKAT